VAELSDDLLNELMDHWWHVWEWEDYMGDPVGAQFALDKFRVYEAEQCRRGH
jgi:hypothetical protein